MGGTGGGERSTSGAVSGGEAFKSGAGFAGALCPVTAVAAEAGGDAAEAAITLAGTVGADVPVEAGAG